MRRYQFTRRYQRQDGWREVEVDNKVVLLRGSGQPEELRPFHHDEELDRFIAAVDTELRAAGFAPAGESAPAGYDHAQARADFQRVAASLGVPREDLRQVLRTHPACPHPLLYLRGLLRATAGVRDELGRRPGDLYAICFGAADEDLRRYDLTRLDRFLSQVLTRGVIFGVADQDAWVELSGDVWRVQPEARASSLPAREFMEEQVRAALRTGEEH